MNRILISLFLILNITACGSDSNSDIDLTGSWKRDNLDFQGWPFAADHTWTFSKNGNFTLNSQISPITSANTAELSFQGSYSLGGKITMPSGKTATQLELIYGNDSNVISDIYSEDNNEIKIVYDLAYIQDNNLFLGARTTKNTEDCTGRYFGFADNDQNILIIYEQSAFIPANLEECYIRPTELDFDNVLYKVE